VLLCGKASVASLAEVASLLLVVKTTKQDYPTAATY